MNPLFVQSLLVAGPFVFGLGAAALMFWFFDLAIQRMPVGDLLKHLFTILGWFFGNEAIILGTFKLVNLSETLQIEEANAVAFLSYLTGFGFGLILISFATKPSLIRQLHKYLSGGEVEAVLLILRYGLDPKDAARALNVAESTVEETFESALRKLSHRGARIIESIRVEAERDLD